MPLMDEFREEREQMKTQPLKKRLDYFWTYYKWWVIGGVAAVIVIISIVVNIVKSKEDLVYIAFVDTVENVGADTEKTIITPFVESQGLNPKKNTLNLNLNFLFSGDGLSADPASEGKPSYANTTGYTSRENLAIYIAAGDVDAICAPDAWFYNYAYSDFFIPLNEYMTDEEISSYGDRVCYVDKAVIDRYKKAHDEDNYDYYEEYPSMDDAADMEEPVAVGICVEDAPLYNQNYLTVDPDAKHIMIGIVRNTPNVSMSKDFIDFLSALN
ncbi:MAG: hypothetical protein K5669_02675 [Lachnospiraceae bacterium]|nr:hypothetical protein [Lachnospiraceae bacterium]